MMKLLRHLVYYASYYLFLLIHIFTRGFFLPYYTPYGISKRFGEQARVLTKIIEKTLGLSCKVKGKENIPWDRPILIVSKHQSGFEAALLSAILPPHVFIVKKELMYVPIAGLVCMATNQILIDRKKKNANELLNAAVQEKFDQGVSLCIFPEGTRTKPGDHNTVYKIGAAHIAQSLKVDILPIALNTGEFFGKGFFKEPGITTVSVLPIIPWDAAKNPKELMQLVKNTIEDEQRVIEGVGPLFQK